MKTTLCRSGTLLFVSFLLTACGSRDEPAATEPTPATAESALDPIPGNTPAPESARVFFITPQDGDIVPETFSVEFGIEGMAVVRAGDNSPNSGHHHLLIDAELPDMTLPIPADANHVHFGDASTSTERTLPPGEHTLQLLFADYLHIPHKPPVYSDRITITVQ